MWVLGKDSISAHVWYGPRTNLQYAQEVELWSHVANLDPIQRASALILDMDSAAREVRMEAGSDQIMDLGGPVEITELLNETT